MKCAECGYENKDGSRFCNYCGAPQVKLPAVSDTGSALRKIYNDFGYEKVFEDSRYITSALNDMIPDSEMLCSSIEHAYRAGLGKLYESQVRSGSRPDAGFYLRVNKLITDDAGFSEKKAKQLIQIFDEMLGWETQDIPGSVSASGPVITTESSETPVKLVESSPVITSEPEPEPAEPASEKPEMSEPEDEVLAALADEEYKAKLNLKAEKVTKKSDAVTVTKTELEVVDEVSEEEPIRSISQEQALKELQPEEKTDIEKRSITKSIDEVHHKQSKDSGNKLTKKDSISDRSATPKKTISKKMKTAIVSIAVVLSIAIVSIIVVLVIKSNTYSDQQGFSAVTNYVYANYDKAYMQGQLIERKIDRDLTNSKEIVIYVKLHGDIYYYHIDRSTGDTYIMHYYPESNIQVRIGEEFNIKKYLY